MVGERTMEVKEEEDRKEYGRYLAQVKVVLKELRM
jgi:hypothetical protein